MAQEGRMVTKNETRAPEVPQGCEVLRGSVTRINYSNDQTGYTVASISLAGGGQCTVVGTLPGLVPGEEVYLEGNWVTHHRYGKQFKVEQFRVVMPVTREGIKRYLGSGLIKGIGPATAERIVRVFGTDALRVIEDEPERLQEIDGIGPRKLAMITQAWEKQKAIREVMVFLQGAGISTSMATKIYRHFGAAAIGVVKNEPYRLAKEIFGIGFTTADRIAAQMGIDRDSPCRVEAGLLHVLGRALEEGHLYLPEPVLTERALELLDVDPPLVGQALEALVKEGEVVMEEREGEKGVYLAPFYAAEVAVARRLRRLQTERPGSLAAGAAAEPRPRTGSVFDREVGEVTLAPEQAEAVRAALRERVLVITGGPGTGKTTTIKAVIQAVEASGRTVLLAAPTGRAAKRLSQVTGRPAKTVHRLLEMRPGQPFDEERVRIEADMLIVDEVSMVDLILMNNLLKAVRPPTHLLLVGDVDQLPSVGAGNVLRDIIDSGAVPVVRLARIFRQEEASWIVKNAHRINRGDPPLWGKEQRDFFYFKAERPEECSDWIVDLVCRRIPANFPYQPREIQVLSPMHRGSAGVGELNRRLQEALNPAGSKPEVAQGSWVFREGDRVIQVVNDYNLKWRRVIPGPVEEREGYGVFNGDIGEIARIDLEEETVTVIFDQEREVFYPFEQLDELTLAYAITVHKSQGSEFPVVLFPLVWGPPMLLARNLFYTAVTRAKEMVILVGDRRPMWAMLRNDSVAQRYSRLKDRLGES